jgi:pyridoxamine 5'-phosphate oxidase
MAELDKNTIANLRVDYTLKSFDEKDVNPNPIKQFEIWMQEAITAQVNEPNAMTLATIKSNSAPSARIVLLKGLQDNGFSFFTNYNSHKADEMVLNPNVALVFCWLELQRQVRIEGAVEKLSEQESDAYFASRPRASQIGAHASQQSTIIKSRTELEDAYQQVEHQFNDQDVPRPKNWGGYLVKPHLIEFWQGRKSRLHDRFCYSLKNNDWQVSRLSP